MTKPPVNRCLKDKAFDHIDHALGRPTWPLRESYRNGFMTEFDSEYGRAFRASPHWEAGPVIPGGLTCFQVTAAGRAALEAHLKALGVHKRFTVTFAEQSTVVSAETPAKARYSRWLDLCDLLPDLTFGAFQRRSTVRRVA